MKGYKETIKAVAEAEMDVNVHARSTIVAFIFEKDVAKVLDDLVEHRRIMLGIKKR